MSSSTPCVTFNVQNLWTCHTTCLWQRSSCKCLCWVASCCWKGLGTNPCVAACLRWWLDLLHLILPCWAKDPVSNLGKASTSNYKDWLSAMATAELGLEQAGQTPAGHAKCWARMRVIAADQSTSLSSAVCLCAKLVHSVGHRGCAQITDMSFGLAWWDKAGWRRAGLVTARASVPIPSQQCGASQPSCMQLEFCGIILKRLMLRVIKPLKYKFFGLSRHSTHAGLECCKYALKHIHNYSWASSAGTIACLHHIPSQNLPAQVRLHQAALRVGEGCFEGEGMSG